MCVTLLRDVPPQEQPRHIAWLRDEQGADVVDAALSEAFMSAVNWSETARKLAQDGDDPEVTLTRIMVLGVQVSPFNAAAAVAAALWASTRSAGLSLGDRACLAPARDRDLPALTADTAWSTVDTDATVRLMR